LAGGIYNDQGAPGNHLCLVPHPLYDPQANSIQFNSDSLPNALYGSEYETSGDDPVYNTNPACALCRSPRSSVAMFPGKNIITVKKRGVIKFCAGVIVNVHYCTNLQGSSHVFEKDFKQQFTLPPYICV
jgi:hypothetical protein